MKALTIKDLARTEELDRTALAAVRGGWKMDSCYKGCDTGYVPSFDSSIHATQNIAQMQDVVNATANGSAFIDCVDVTNDVSQDAKNKIVRN